MKYSQQIQELLDQHGAVLQRNKRHLVYALPNGNKFTMAKTPSDERSAANALADLRRVLGLVEPERGKPGERRPRKAAAAPQRKPRIHAAPQNGALADQLRLHGVEADALRKEIAQLQEAMAEATRAWQGMRAERDGISDSWAMTTKDRDRLLAERHRLLAERRDCWACRLRDWWRNR